MNPMDEKPLKFSMNLDGNLKPIRKKFITIWQPEKMKRFAPIHSNILKFL